MPIKIIDLQSEDAPTDDDLIVIRDNLTQTTRKVTRAKFFENPPIADGAITEDMIADGAISKIKLGIDAKISVRTRTQASPGTLTPDMVNYDAENVTTLNGAMTIAAPLNTVDLLNKQGILFSFKDNGTEQALNWNVIYRPIGITLPTSTTAGKMTYVAGRWNTEAQKIDILSVARES